MNLAPFGLEAQYREYVWGGQRLRPGQQTAEAWVVHEQDRITSGPLAGRTLAEACAEWGAALLGERVAARTGGQRFPLLIKLLDCAQWLSLQVHPNDQQAVELEGPGHFGKTEAWHILEAAPGAEILCGFKADQPGDAVLRSVQDGSILDYAQNVPMHTGETVFIRPGTLHALGPGLLVYEVQQTSDITYRVFDWNRPAAAGRKLHIEQSLAVLDPSASGKPIPPPQLADGETARLVSCEYFTLDLLATQHKTIPLDPQQQTFHILTAIEGQAEARGPGWSLPFGRFETILIPAAVGAYELASNGDARVLKASVE